MAFIKEFNKMRNSIIKGIYITTMEIACELAGLQCQIEMDYDCYIIEQQKFESNLFDLLPKDYVSIENIESKILNEYKKYGGLTKTDAINLYIKTVQNLPSYGAKFFFVKQKKTDENIMSDQLLGIKNDSIIILDQNTKDILYNWPMTTIKRWSKTSTSITFDFGEYSDEYFTYITTEADQIAQCLTFYINIILQRMKKREKLNLEKKSKYPDDYEFKSVQQEKEIPNITEFVNCISDEQNCNKSIEILVKLYSNLETKKNQFPMELNYSECLTQIFASAKNLSFTMSVMANVAKISHAIDFTNTIIRITKCIEDLIKMSVQFLHLLEYRTDFIDQNILRNGFTCISNSWNILAEPESTNEEIKNAISVITQYSYMLCNICHQSIMNNSAINEKYNYIQSATDLIQSTTIVLKLLQNVEKNDSYDIRFKTTSPILDLLNLLYELSTNSMCNNDIENINTSNDKLIQTTIITSSEKIIQQSIELIKSIKILIETPQSVIAWEQIALHYKSISNNIKTIISNMTQNAAEEDQFVTAIIRLIRCERKLDSKIVTQIFNNDKINENLHYLIKETSLILKELYSKLLHSDLTTVILIISNLISKLIENLINIDYLLTITKQNNNLIDQGKLIVYCTVNLIQSENLNETLPTLLELLKSLELTIIDLPTEIQCVSVLLKQMNDSIINLTERHTNNIQLSSTSISKNNNIEIIHNAKKIVDIVRDIINAKTLNHSKQIKLFTVITKHFALLINNYLSIINECQSNINERLEIIIKNIGKSIILLIETLETFETIETISVTSRIARDIAEKVSRLIEIFTFNMEQNNYKQIE